LGDRSGASRGREITLENPVHYLRFNNNKQLPTILQSEVAECGLACIAMIASYHGHKVNLNTLRRDYPTSLKGVDLDCLMTTADNLNFASKALRLPLNKLNNLQLPCILHWDLNHFVVLSKVSKKKITIIDPATGKQELTIDEASNHFTGVALELQPNKQFEKKNEEVSMRLSDLWGSISGLKKVIVQIFMLSLLLQVLALLGPFYVQLVVDDVVVGNDIDLLNLLALGFGLLALISVGSGLLRSYIVMYFGSQLNIQISSNLFRHLLHLPFDFLAKRHIGDVVSRFQSIKEIKNLLTTGAIEVLVDGLLIIGTLVMMYIYSGLLATIVLMTVLIYSSIRMLLFTRLRKYSEEAIVASSKERTNFLETVRAFQCIKLFARESQSQMNWCNHYARFINAEMLVNKFKFTNDAIKKSLFALSVILVIYIAAKLILQNEFSVGMLFAFLAYNLQFSTKAADLIEKIIEFRMLGLHLSRIADIAMTPVEAIGERNAHSPRVEGHLTLKDISYQYSTNEPVLLKQVNYSFEAGKTTAIVGVSGCGKTTLVKIMLGLLKPSDGSVQIDGIDINQFGLSNFRSQVASVMQNDQLLSGSLLENISFLDPSFDFEWLQECAKIAHIHDDIMAMPMGYNSLVGDMGTTLSGGQKQRLLLARALYAKPKILFLDEATSALDQSLESDVSAAIKKLKITRIVIAHRRETIRAADQVVRLRDGQLFEEQLQKIASVKPPPSRHVISC
jgi:ATP-binding cassette subfamily B protein RaxB